MISPVYEFRIPLFLTEYLVEDIWRSEMYFVHLESLLESQNRLVPPRIIELLRGLRTSMGILDRKWLSILSRIYFKEDEYLGVGSAGMGSRSNSISSFQSVHSGQVDSNVPSERAVKRSNSRPPIPAHMLLAPTSSNGEKAAEEIAEKVRVTFFLCFITFKFVSFMMIVYTQHEICSSVDFTFNRNLSWTGVKNKFCLPSSCHLFWRASHRELQDSVKQQAVFK